MQTLQKNRLQVGLFQRAMALANWLATLPNRLTPPPFRLIQIGSAYWHSRALYLATHLGIADELADGEQDTRALADRLSLHEENLYRLLRMLASIGIFDEVSHRHFRNSRLSAHLRRDHPQGVREMVLLHNSPQMVRPWVDGLEAAIRSGEVPFVQSHGEELFDYLDSQPEFDALFSSAMDTVEAITGSDYLHDFDWSRFDRLIDVGGAYGSKAIAILQHHPQMRALVFDRPQVAAEARQHWQQRGIQVPLERVEFVGGDMREALPPATGERDLYLFIAVFHGMADEEVAGILRNLQREISQSRASAVIVDTVAQECGIDPAIASFDMQMLIGTRGRERTEREWRALLAGAGLEIAEIINVRSFAKFIVVTTPNT